MVSRVLAAATLLACAGTTAGVAMGAPAAATSAHGEARALGARPAAESAPVPGGRRLPPRHGDDLALLGDVGADISARGAAARRLIAATDPDVRRTIADLLAPGAEHAEARGVLLRELRGTANAPGWLVAPLARLAAESVPAEQPPVLEALGSIRTRESVRVLLGYTAPPAGSVVREAAVAALTRLTGRAEFGRDPEVWRAWFTDLEWRSEGEWQRALLEGLAQNADRAARDRDRWIARTLEAMRKAYVDETQPAERSALLASFLRDDLAPVRRLGVELLNRELANARVPDETISRAALNLLRDPQADLRQAGAELVSILNPVGGSAALTNALLAESDPAVAAAMLRSAALTPSAAIRPVVMRWLSAPGPAQRSALDAAATLVERGLIDPAEVRDQLLASLRSVDLGVLPGSGLRLLSSLGTEDDRIAVASQLTSGATARRVQAAEALSAHAAYLPRLLEAARQDPALFMTACRAIAAHDATVEGFLSALPLPATSEEARRDGLMLIVARMDRRDLLTAAGRTDELALRELVLSRLTAVPLRVPTGVDGGFVPEPTVVGGLLLLADTRLELRQPAGALAVIEALTPVREFVDPDACNRVRTVALLWLNRIEEAAGVGSPLASWLDGLEKAAGLTHAVDVLEAIDRRFPKPRAGTPELARLRALRDQIVAPMGPPPPVGGGESTQGPTNRTSPG